MEIAQIARERIELSIWQIGHSERWMRVSECTLSLGLRRMRSPGVRLVDAALDDICFTFAKLRFGTESARAQPRLEA
eukprot:1535285-Pleurochrysis_carterae.AAC.1